MSAYSIRGLEKSFDVEERRLPVLRGLDLTGSLDEITVILGRSGCGKTTLLRVLAGLEQADAGDINAPSPRELAMVFQEPALMPWLTVERNVTFGLDQAKADDARIANLIATVGLNGFASAYPAQLSGGMAHRVALARALAREPALVLMDEPFAALDYFTREAMQRELLRLHLTEGMGALFVTHNIDEALLLGDRICIMADGKISAEFRQEAAASWRDLLTPEATALKRRVLAALETPTLKADAPASPEPTHLTPDLPD